MNKEEIINELKKDLIYNQYRDTYVVRGENLPFLAERLAKLFPQPTIDGILCGSFDLDNITSSATKCKCGREKWEHPNQNN